MNEITKPQPRAGALQVMATRFSVEPAKLLETLKATAFKNATNEEMMALVIVANEYGLNPFTKEIYAFPAKGGGIQPVVSVDGWLRLMNAHPQFDGIEFEEVMAPDGKPDKTTAIIHRKDRSKPTRVTEYFSEDYRNTDPWNTKPRRMLRHKATIQAVRTAFGFSGITDEDDLPPTLPPVPSSVMVFDAGPPQSLTPKANDHAEEADAGLAPVPEKPVAAAEFPNQTALAKVVTDAGYTLDEFLKWGTETGNIPDAGSIGSFDEVPGGLCQRFLKAQGGLLKGLAQVHGGAK